MLLLKTTIRPPSKSEAENYTYCCRTAGRGVRSPRVIYRVHIQFDTKRNIFSAPVV